MIPQGVVLSARERARSIHGMKTTLLVCCSVLAVFVTGPDGSPHAVNFAHMILPRR